MNELNPYDVILQCSKTKSLKKRKEILSKNDTPDLRQVLFFVLNPFLSFSEIGNRNFPEPTLHKEPFDYCFNEVYTFCMELSRGGCKDIATRFLRATASLNVEQQAVAKMMFSKSLGFKLTVATVNELFSKLIPSYKFPKFDYNETIESAYPCVVRAYKSGDFFIACVNGNKIIKVDENSETTTKYKTYDKELIKLVNGGKRNLLCFCLQSPKSKLWIVDLLSHENTVNGTVTRGKRVLNLSDKLSRLFAESEFEYLKPFKYKLLHSESQLESWKSRKLEKNKKLVGFMIRDAENKQIQVEVLT